MLDIKPVPVEPLGQGAAIWPWRPGDGSVTTIRRLEPGEEFLGHHSPNGSGYQVSLLLEGRLEGRVQEGRIRRTTRLDAGNGPVRMIVGGDLSMELEAIESVVLLDYRSRGQLILLLPMQPVLYLQPASWANERGKRTWIWLRPGGGQTTVCRRLTGEVFGGHYHTGIDPDRDPEQLLLVAGDLHGHLIRNDGQRCCLEMSAGEVPQALSIPPWVGHTMAGLSDCLILEHRRWPLADAPADVHPLNGLTAPPPACAS